LLPALSISSLSSVFRVGSRLIEGLIFGGIGHVIIIHEVEERNGVYKVIVTIH
jgi:hypothetical protein